MQIYLFDSKTGLYAGESEATPGGIPGSWMFPLNAAPEPPPSDLPPNKRARWNGFAWEAVDAPTLEEVRRAKIAAVDARTAELITAGFSFAGKQFSMSEAAQRNWGALASALALGMLPFPLIISTVDESYHTILSANELRAFLGAYMLYQSDPAQPLGTGRALKEQAALAGTVEEVEEIEDDRE